MSLGVSARAAILWGASFTILADLFQFTAMIVLVRLLSPEDYGRFAMAQSIVLLLSYLGSKSFVTHTLQVRDPAEIPWQLHFTAGCLLNTAVFVLSLGVAAALAVTQKFESAAAPLAVMSIGHLLDVPAGVATARLKVAHDWRRHGALVTLGTFLGLAVAIIIASLGGGVWALISTSLISCIPLSVNLFIVERWLPDWSWDSREYRNIASFGFTRVGTAALYSVRNATEKAVLAANINLSALGIFTRSVGLATLITGRIGTQLSTTLLPVVTRAEESSEHFRRVSGYILQCIAWLSIPTAAFLMLSAQDTVALLYGPKWSAVAPLLPFATASVTMSSLAVGASNLLLANNRSKACLALECGSALTGVLLIFALVPEGPKIYLVGMALQGAMLLIATILVLRASGGVRLRSIVLSLVPPVLASTAGGVAISQIGLFIEQPKSILFRLLVEGATFACVYLTVLRVAFAEDCRKLLNFAPAGQKLAKVMWL